MFYRDNLKSFKISKNAETVLNFSYLAIKLPNFKSVNEKLHELQPRQIFSFDIKKSLEKKAFKSFGVPSGLLPVKNFCFKICSVYEISQYFFSLF